jgi:predicted permease
MQTLARFFGKLRVLFGGEQFRRDLEEEMAFHREHTEQALIADGMSPEEARYAAKRQFGNDSHLKEQTHELAGFWFESTLQDIAFTFRQLQKNPAFACTAILILALGICASVSIFAFVDAAMIKPLPYKEPAKLVGLYESIPLGPRYHLSFPDYEDWKKLNKVFSSLDIYENDGFMLTTTDGAQKADGARVSDGFFRTLGVTPMLGRDFRPGEDQPSAAGVVLLSYSAWEMRYGRRDDILGQTITLDGSPHTVIGVLPADFHFAPAEPAEFWTNSLFGNRSCRGCHGLYGIARIKDGVRYDTAYADIKAVGQQLALQYPDTNRLQAAFMLPLTEIIVGDIRPVLLVSLCGAGLLLLIACVNIASLLLVRSESRRREIAVRGALGASPARLVRQFITEGLALVTIGGVLGVIAARASMHLLIRLVPKDMLASMPFLHGLGFNGRIVAFSIAISGVAAILFSLAPMLRLRWSEVRADLAEGGRNASGIGWRRLGANLVIVELATATLLLVGAGLLAKSFYRLLQVDTGMKPDHLATLTLNTPYQTYSKPGKTVALERDLVGHIGNLPGVKSVGLCNRLPLGDADGTTEFVVVGRPKTNEHNEVTVRSVSAAYFSTLQTPLVSGRYFAEDEDNSKPGVVIINQALARRYFPNEDPVGKQMRFNFDKAKPMEIIGIVEEVKEGQLDMPPRAAFYVPFNQLPMPFFSLIVRTSQSPQSLLLQTDKIIHEVDPSIAVFGEMTMEDRIHDSPSAYLHRSSAWLVGGFAVLALLLGVVGLYGVIAYSVSQRTREIGVRMALGAQRGTVYRLILSESGRLIAWGIGTGLLCSLVATAPLRKLLFGVRPWDITTLVTVAFLLAVATLLASYIPARRAAAANPMDALRTE